MSVGAWRKLSSRQRDEHRRGTHSQQTGAGPSRHVTLPTAARMLALESAETAVAVDYAVLDETIAARLEPKISFRPTESEATAIHDAGLPPTTVLYRDAGVLTGYVGVWADGKTLNGKRITSGTYLAVEGPSPERFTLGRGFATPEAAAVCYATHASSDALARAARRCANPLTGTEVLAIAAQYGVQLVTSGRNETGYVGVAEQKQNGGGQFLAKLPGETRMPGLWPTAEEAALRRAMSLLRTPIPPPSLQCDHCGLAFVSVKAKAGHVSRCASRRLAMAVAHDDADAPPSSDDEELQLPSDSCDGSDAPSSSNGLPLARAPLSRGKRPRTQLQRPSDDESDSVSDGGYWSAASDEEASESDESMPSDEEQVSAGCSHGAHATHGGKLKSAVDAELAHHDASSSDGWLMQAQLPRFTATRHRRTRAAVAARMLSGDDVDSLLDTVDANAVHTSIDDVDVTAFFEQELASEMLSAGTRPSEMEQPSCSATRLAGAAPSPPSSLPASQVMAHRSCVWQSRLLSCLSVLLQFLPVRTQQEGGFFLSNSSSVAVWPADVPEPNAGGAAPACTVLLVLVFAVLTFLTAASLSRSCVSQRDAGRWLFLAVLLGRLTTVRAGDGLAPEHSELLASLVTIYGVERLVSVLHELLRCATPSTCSSRPRTARQRPSPVPLTEPLPMWKLHLTSAWSTWMKYTVHTMVIGMAANQLLLRRLQLAWAVWRHEFTVAALSTRAIMCAWRRFVHCGRFAEDFPATETSLYGAGVDSFEEGFNLLEDRMVHLHRALGALRNARDRTRVTTTSKLLRCTSPSLTSPRALSPLTTEPPASALPTHPHFLRSAPPPSPPLSPPYQEFYWNRAPPAADKEGAMLVDKEGVQPSLANMEGAQFSPLTASRALLKMLSTELAAASAAASGTVRWTDLGPRQTLRTALHSRRQEARRLAWVYLWHVPRHLYAVLAFCYRLRARALASPSAVARRLVAAERHRVALLHSAGPRPMAAFDVGSDADGNLAYRSCRGSLGSTHPALSPDPAVLGVVPQADGSTLPVQPPSVSSGWVVVPDESGAVCYHHRSYGMCQWEFPAGASDCQTGSLPRLAHCPDMPELPLHPPGLGLTSAPLWLPLFEDNEQHVRLYHVETGAVRDGPWIVVRHASGRPLYVNFATDERRWLAPLDWMCGWVSRPRESHGNVFDTVFDERHRVGQLRWPVAVSRVRVEGGAPPWDYSVGMPQYPSDDMDSYTTYPMDKPS